MKDRISQQLNLVTKSANSVLLLLLLVLLLLFSSSSLLEEVEGGRHVGLRDAWHKQIRYLCAFEVPRTFKDETSFIHKMLFWLNTQTRASQECATFCLVTTWRLMYTMALCYVCLTRFSIRNTVRALDDSESDKKINCF